MRKWLSVLVVLGRSWCRGGYLHPLPQGKVHSAQHDHHHGAGPRRALTGLPDPGGAALTPPALTVKIENTPEALPQWGIDQADVVYEEIVNGGITRLAAIFTPRRPPRSSGPFGSTTDTQVVYPLKAIFAFSGGAPYAISSIENRTWSRAGRRGQGRRDRSDVPRPGPLRAAQSLRHRVRPLCDRRLAQAAARALLVPQRGYER